MKCPIGIRSHWHVFDYDWLCSCAVSSLVTGYSVHSDMMIGLAVIQFLFSIVTGYSAHSDKYTKINKIYFKTNKTKTGLFSNKLKLQLHINLFVHILFA